MSNFEQAEQAVDKAIGEILPESYGGFSQLVGLIGGCGIIDLALSEGER